MHVLNINGTIFKSGFTKSSKKTLKQDMNALILQIRYKEANIMTLKKIYQPYHQQQSLLKEIMYSKSLTYAK